MKKEKWKQLVKNTFRLQFSLLNYELCINLFNFLLCYIYVYLI